MKTSLLALLALVMTASLTFAAGSFQTTVTDDPPVMDCWANLGDVNDENKPPPDTSTQEHCKGLGGECCYNLSGSFSEI